MIEEYIQHWGLSQHPFLLAPDSRMMHMAGQYYECLERLKYAVNTSKGGVLVISEDAGLGKTTTLLKLIDEMKGEYGESFRYAFIDHPTLTVPQLIAHISKSISGIEPDEDKLKNLMVLKDALIDVKRHGGKSIIVVDEGQMLCGAHDILQELRILINLTYNNEYLHTFIFSGQRPLWDEVKSMPEFWQRLPVRYYFVPLRLEETKELIKYRLMKAGLDDRRDIFTDDAFDIIQRYSMGSPRTIIAIADLSLLIGYTDRSSKIGFKEMSKAINAMSGKGESLPYVVEERKRKKEPSLGSYAELDRGSEIITKRVSYKSSGLAARSEAQGTASQVRPFFMALTVIFFLLLGAVSGYYFAFMGSNPPFPIRGMGQPAVRLSDGQRQTEGLSEEKQTQQEPEGKKQQDNAEVKAEQIVKDAVDALKLEQPQKVAVVIKKAANLRKGPSMRADRIGMIFKGEEVKIVDEKTDTDDQKWYKFYLYGNREGWISEKVVNIKQ